MTANIYSTPCHDSNMITDNSQKSMPLVSTNQSLARSGREKRRRCWGGGSKCAEWEMRILISIFINPPEVNYLNKKIINPYPGLLPSFSTYVMFSGNIRAICGNMYFKNLVFKLKNFWKTFFVCHLRLLINFIFLSDSKNISFYDLYR